MMVDFIHTAIADDFEAVGTCFTGFRRAHIQVRKESAILIEWGLVWLRLDRRLRRFNGLNAVRISRIGDRAC